MYPYNIGDIPISGAIGLTNPADTYPTFVDQLGQGGWQTIDTTSSRDIIPAARRSFGMITSTQDGSGTFILANASMGGTDNTITNNANWIPFASSGGGITSINTDTTAAQLLLSGTGGVDFGITNNLTGTHVINLPFADATHTGKLSSTDWQIFNGKLNPTLTQNHIFVGNASNLAVDAGGDFLYVPGTGTSGFLSVTHTNGAASDQLFLSNNGIGMLSSTATNIANVQTTHTGIIDIGLSLNGGTSTKGILLNSSGFIIRNVTGTTTFQSKWPITNGTAGQVLTTDGTNNPAVLSWTTASTGTIGGTIAATQIGYGSGVNTLTSDANWTRSAYGITLQDNPTQRNIFIGTAFLPAGNATATGAANIALGEFALPAITSGQNNMAFGAGTLDTLQSGSNNTAFGYGSLQSNVTGSDLTALGAGISVNASNRTNSIAIGSGAGITMNNQFVVGDAGTPVNNWQIAGIDYIMPSAYGSAGDVLTDTDGAGTLAWQAGGGGSITGFGAATQVAFWNGATSLTGDNSLWFDSTNGRLGVGEDTPQFDIDAKNITGTSIDPAVYFGSGGLDDLTNGGTFTGTTGLTYDVLIDGNDGTEDTFQWTDGITTVTGVPITGAAQNLSFGVTITFGATTGHVIGSDEWGWDTHVALGAGVINISGSTGQYNINNSFFAGRDGSNNYAINTTGIDGAWSDVTAFGALAGNGVTQIQGTYIGSNAGSGAVLAFQCTFLGYLAGQNAVNASQSVFIGGGSGLSAMNVNNAVFIGTSAGSSATDAFNSVFIGQSAGNGASTANDSIFIGNQAGITDTVNNSTGGTSILIGKNTSTGGFSNSIALGTSATNTVANEFMIASDASPIDHIRVNQTGGVVGNVPVVVASADATGQTAAIADVLGTLGTGAFTPQVDGSYKIGGYVTVNSILLTPILNVWVDYVNENGTAIHKGLIFQTVSNTPSSVVTIQVATSYFVYDFEIRAKSGTAVTFSTTQTGTINYDIGISLMYMGH